MKETQAEIDKMTTELYSMLGELVGTNDEEQRELQEFLKDIME